MAHARTTTRPKVADVIAKYGKCLELIPMDPNFHDVTFGLYVKDGIATVWTFSQRPGVEERVRKIRDQLVALGGLEPVEGASNQVRFPCGYFHVRPIRFLMAQAVEKNPEYRPPEGEMAIRDTKTKLTLSVAGREESGRWIYRVMGEGEAPNIPMRLRAVVAGFVRYGEMEKVSDTEVTFPCGYQHDKLVRLLLPYARNISAVETMLEAEALRGQMTVQTLGFTQR
jgi:hypothetical protein